MLVDSYGLFTSERRATLRQEQPHLTFAETVKLMGNEWTALQSDVKEVSGRRCRVTSKG